MKLLTTLICSFFSVYLNASTVYSDQGPWRILQVHETFSFDKKHSHCTAYRTLGDRTLFFDIDRKFIEDFTLVEDSMISLRYFDNAFSLQKDTKQSISLKLNDSLIGPIEGYPISYQATSKAEYQSHSPYVLAIVDKDTSSLDIRLDSEGAASITQRDRRAGDDMFEIRGMQLSLNIENGLKMSEFNDGSMIFEGMSEFPAEGVSDAIDTLIECNRNVISAEINLSNITNEDEFNDPFAILIQRNLPATEKNQPIFMEHMTELVEAYAPSVRFGQSKFWSNSDMENEGYGPDGTLSVWSGEYSFGSFYYNQYVFDDLRKRKANGHYRQCVSRGGTMYATGIKKNKELGLIGNEQALWCNGLDGDPNSNLIHFLYSIYSEFNGASIGIEDSLFVDRDLDEMEKIWESTVKDYPDYQQND